MTLGEKIQDLRRKNAMSQDVLAEKLEVSRQAVSKWERDEAVPETDKIVRLAQLFSVSTDYLLMQGTKEQAQSAPQSQNPPRQERPSPADRVERFVRRHGYKGGYLLTGYGAICSMVGLIFRWFWQRMVFGMTDSVQSTVDSMLGGAMPAVPGVWGDPADSFYSGYQSTVGAMTQQAASWGNMFLILLLPGGILIGLGIFVLVKGKLISQKAQ